MPLPGLFSCDRNYARACPQHFVDVGPVHGGAQQFCAASPEYHGPCGDEVYSFEGWTLAAKQRWSLQCQAFWDCQSCARDYQVACPQSWAPVLTTWKLPWPLQGNRRLLWL